MEARITRAALVAALLFVSMGASSRSPNFLVSTDDPKLAAQVAAAAEKYRHDLAIAWLGHAMPDWMQPCVMTVQAGPNLGAGGATTFVFDRGEVYGWRMTIQGSVERIFDSVLPHEITHMVFASHFRQPLPRWADEGGATSVEHCSERDKHRRMLIRFLQTGRGIAFSRMFALADYPADVMPLYAQGYSLAEYLIQRGGRRKFVEFLADGLQSDHWSTAVERHYGFASLGSLQNTWLTWVRQGFPNSPSREAAPDGELLAGGGKRTRPVSSRIRPAGSGPESAGNVRPDRTEAADRGRPSDTKLASAARVDPGWHAVGASPTRPPSPTAAVSSPGARVRSQVARPQPVQKSRQIILEWSKP